MKTLKASLFILISSGIFATANAQYYYGPPPPPPPGYRHHQESKDKDDDGSTPTGYFGLSIGAAVPVGSFANEFGGTNTNYTNPPTSINFPAGYALSGLNFNVSLGIPVNHSNLGIALQYSSASNPFDINTYNDNLAETDLSKNYRDGVVSDEYSSSFIMVGLFATIPIQRLSFDFKLMGGIALCYTPEVGFSADGPDPTIPTQTDVYTWDISSSNNASLAFGVGADLRYKIRRASLLLGVDFLTTTVNINSQEQYTDPYNYNYYTHVGGSVTISVVNPYIGVAYDIR